MIKQMKALKFISNLFARSFEFVIIADIPENPKMDRISSKEYIEMSQWYYGEELPYYCILQIEFKKSDFIFFKYFLKMYNNYINYIYGILWYLRIFFKKI